MIFIDEVTFSIKTFKPYAWSSKATNVTQEAHLGSQPCQAVVGAASASQGLILWHVRPKSFDAQGLRDFLTDLRESIGPGPRTLMLDNASIHRAKATVAHAESLGFNIVWNVPYHPEFNGIEYVWSIAKSHFKKVQLQRMLSTTPCTFKEGIWRSLSAVSFEQVQNCIRHGTHNLDAAITLDPPNANQTTDQPAADDVGMSTAQLSTQ